MHTGTLLFIENLFDYYAMFDIVDSVEISEGFPKVIEFCINFHSKMMFHAF